MWDEQIKRDQRAIRRIGVAVGTGIAALALAALLEKPRARDPEAGRARTIEGRLHVAETRGDALVTVSSCTYESVPAYRVQIRRYGNTVTLYDLHRDRSVDHVFHAQRETAQELYSKYVPELFHELARSKLAEW